MQYQNSPDQLSFVLILYVNLIIGALSSYNGHYCSLDDE